VLNERAVELALVLGQALHCSAKHSVFARKNYFYPDMPKDYQVSQYDLPTNVDGYLDLPSGLRVGIERAHIEEDTGKNTHVGSGSGRIHGADYSLIDYNRAGVPLVEIVSRPDMRTAEQAREYVNELRAILVATGASDAKMEEGSLRVDANVSVHRPGTPFGTRCEIKNLNSVRSLGRAIDYEARRQVELIESGERVRQETRHWDESDGRTRTGRSKEEAEDYRYFPEPDLVPLDPDEAWVGALRAGLPSLPAERRAALATRVGADSGSSGIVLAVQRDLDAIALAAIDAGGDPARVLTHVEHNLAVDGAEAIDPVKLATLTRLEVDGKLTATQAKTVLAEIVATGDAPEEIAARHGFEAMDTAALDEIVDRAIADNAAVWAKVVAGDDKAIGAIVGAVMKASKGKADGKVVNQLLQQRRASA
jgi:aspartyl-tRNA(Asn)/glutamyl-tRNA(Gln) amidotransferase subunit B